MWLSLATAFACNAQDDEPDAADTGSSDSGDEEASTTGGVTSEGVDPDSSTGDGSSSSDGAPLGPVPGDDEVAYHEDLGAWEPHPWISVLDNDGPGDVRPSMSVHPTDGGHEARIDFAGRVTWGGDGELEDSFSYTVVPADDITAPPSEPATITLTVEPATHDLEDLRDANASHSIGGVEGEVQLRTLGDLDGDGYGEIGLWGGPDDPQLRIVLGTAGALPSYAELTSGATGFSVGPVTRMASAGDFNGDGIDDLFVREAPAGGPTAPSSAWVVFGAPAMSDVDTTDPDGGYGFRLDFPDTVLGVGSKHAPAGDFNGDGYDDVMVAAQFGDTPSGASGNVVIIFGRPDAGTSTIEEATAGNGGVAIYAGAPHEYVGQVISAAGDVNGDGYDDVMLSGYESGGPRAWVVFGSANPTAVELDALQSAGFQIDLGTGGPTDVDVWHLSGIGDIDSDGLDDVAIGDAGYGQDTGDVHGKLVVVWGKADDATVTRSELFADGGPGFVIDGGPEAGPGLPKDTLHFAENVTGIGDLDGDGFDDFVFSAERANRYNPFAGGVGRIYVAHGRPRTEAYDLSGRSQGQGGYVLIGGRQDSRTGVRLGVVPRPGGFDLAFQRGHQRSDDFAIEVARTDGLSSAR